MNCPICNHTETRVIRSSGARRRRKCERCEHRWTTVELGEKELDRLKGIESAAQNLQERLARG